MGFKAVTFASFSKTAFSPSFQRKEQNTFVMFLQTLIEPEYWFHIPSERPSRGNYRLEFSKKEYVPFHL